MHKHLFILGLVLLSVGCGQMSQFGSNQKPMIVRGQSSDENRSSSPERSESLPGNGTTVLCKDNIPMKLVIAETIPLFDTPQGRQIGKELNLFDLVYVQEIKDQGGVGEDRWMKVSFGRAAGSELGWIRFEENSAFPWVHRIGFRPLRMGKSLLTRLPVYESFEDCRNALEGKDVAPIGDYDLPKPDDRRAARNPWPIIERMDLTVEGNTVSAYRVCMIGQMQKRGVEAKKSYSHGEIVSIRKELKTFDILVVMDTTGSMGKWMEAAKISVQTFVSIFNQDGIDAKFSLSTFRDVGDGGEIYQNFPFESANAFCQRLGSLKADGGGDDDEAGYPALMESLKRAEYRHRSERILLLVGDAPYHKSGPSNPRKYGNSDVISAAKKSNTQVFVLAVADATALAAQVSDIAVGTNGRSFTLSSTQSLIGEISSILRQEAAEIRDTVNVYEGLVRGESAEIIATSMGRDVNEITSVIRILRDVKGIDPDKLSSGEPVGMSGWITPINGAVNSGTLDVFLFRIEAEEILKVLQEILRLSPDTSIGPRIWSTAQDERLRNEPIGIFFKENVLPYRSTSILSFSLKEIRGMSEANRARIQDEVFPLIRKLDAEIKEETRWVRLEDGRIRGWVSESCLP